MRPEWMCCALMTLLLGGGDAIHLVPRILLNIRGEASGSAGEKRDALFLGLGNLVSSVTMTLFYIIFFLAVYYRSHPEAAAAAREFSGRQGMRQGMRKGMTECFLS